MTRRENVILAMRHKETLWLPNNITDCDVTLQSAVEERYEGDTEGADEFGTVYVYTPDSKSPVPKIGVPVVTDWTNWESQAAFPDLDARDWEAAAKRDTKDWDRENRFSIVQLHNGMFERLIRLSTFEDALCALLEDPDAVLRFFEAYTVYRVGLIKRVHKYYKPDAIMNFDDYSTDNSMFMSLATWRTMIKPYLKRTIDAVHECGMFYILHCCGHVLPLIEDIVELGADAIHPLQISNKPLEIKRKYGDKLCICGGFDNVGVLDREGVTEQESRTELCRVMTELGEGGSYIAWRSFFCQLPDVFTDEVKKIALPAMKAHGTDIPEAFRD